jgi:hypothetical protein
VLLVCGAELVGGAEFEGGREVEESSQYLGGSALPKASSVKTAKTKAASRFK